MGSHLTLRPLEFPPPARDPLRIALAVSAFVQGVALILGGPAPGTTAASFAGLSLYIWGIGLGVAGAVLVLAAVWRDVITGVLIELVGCALAVLALGAYVAGAVGVIGIGQAVILPILTPAAYAVGCAFRVGYIARDLRRGTLAGIRRRRGRPTASG